MLKPTVSRILAFHRMSKGETRRRVASRLFKIATSKKTEKQLMLWLFKRRPKPNRIEKSIEDKLKLLEAGSISDPGKDLVTILCKAYDIDYSLIFPYYFSQTSNGQVKAGFTDFYKIPKENGCTYSFPTSRLLDADFVLLRLKLSPGASTETHSHRGDEMIFVLKGSVEVSMIEMGYNCRALQKHEYAHFYAELPHSIENSSTTAPCELIVIRFNQPTGGYRELVLENIVKFENNLKTNNLPEAKKTFDNIIGPWLRGFTPQCSDLKNPQGLASFIKIAMNRANINLHQLTTRSGKEFSRRRLSQLMNCAPHSTTFTKNEAAILANALSIPPVLLHTYFYPRVQNWLAVRADEFNEVLISEEEPSIGFYRVPIRHLVGSNLSINLLELNQRSATGVFSSHPGSELLIALEGEATLNLRGYQQINLSSNENQTACFSSNYEHELSVSNSDRFAGLVVRSYGSIPEE